MKKQIMIGIAGGILAIGVIAYPVHAKFNSDQPSDSTSATIHPDTTAVTPAAPADSLPTGPVADNTAPAATAPSSTNPSGSGTVAPAQDVPPTAPPAVTLLSSGMKYNPTADGGLDNICAFQYSDGSSKEVMVGHTSGTNVKVDVDCPAYQ